MVNSFVERTQHFTMTLQFNDIAEIIGFENVTNPIFMVGYHSTTIASFMDNLITDVIYSPPELQNV